MKTKTEKIGHEHSFTRSKPDATVETCACGRFRFTENAGPAIVEQRPIADKSAQGFANQVRGLFGLDTAGARARRTKYRGYSIIPSGDNFRVATPDGEVWNEIAASRATARKWIDAHWIEAKSV